jgi:hypothetical protein
VDSAAVGAALHSIVTELRQHWDNFLSVILQSVQAPTSPNTKENPTVLPMLKAYGVSLDDLRVHANLLRDLYFLTRNMLRVTLSTAKSVLTLCHPLFMSHPQKGLSKECKKNKGVS